MKRYEEFNKLYGDNESAEEQALGMILSHIQETYDIEITDIEPLKKRYLAQIKWLNEDV